MFGMVVGEGGGKGKGLHSIGNSPTSARVIFYLLFKTPAQQTVGSCCVI